MRAISICRIKMKISFFFTEIIKWPPFFMEIREYRNLDVIATCVFETLKCVAKADFTFKDMILTTT